MNRPKVFPSDRVKRVPVPRKPRAAVTIQFRDWRRGDSVTLNLHPAPWPNRWLCAQGHFSSAHLGRALTLMLNSASA